MKHTMEDEAHRDNHMQTHLENKGNIVKYNPAWNTYYLLVDPAGPSEAIQDVYFCPWCGEKLPENYQDMWHSEIENAGIDWRTDKIPDRFLTDQWRRQQ